VLRQTGKLAAVSNGCLFRACFDQLPLGATVPSKATSSVRRQLWFAFATVIILSCLTTGLAVWRLQLLSQGTHALAQGPQAKERLIAQWVMNITVAINRTSAVARANDPDLAKVIGEESRRQSLRTSELQDKVGQLLALPEERAMFGRIVELRAQYVAARDRVMALKTEGKGDEARALYEGTFIPVTSAYVGKVEALLALQQKTIDDHAAGVVDDADRSIGLLEALCGVTLVVGIGAAALFGRDLFRRLGSEPAVAVDVANAIAAGNLRVDVPVAPGDETSLMVALKFMRDSLADLVGQVRTSTATIGESLASLSSDSQDLALRTENQAAALEETASSMEQLTQAIGHSAASAEEANTMAAEAARVAQQGGAMVGQLVETMGAINGSSARIVDIIAVIDGIAFQTNILALNAAVEAARAGEQGRGFAVVAGEVRALAQRSASAAREIKELIDDSTLRIADGSALAGRAGDTMRGIVDSITRVTGIMNEIVASSREQASGIAQVNGAIVQMDGMTQQNATLVEESAAATRAMHEQATALEELVAVFDVEPSTSAPVGLEAPPPTAAAPSPRALPQPTQAATARTSTAPTPPPRRKPSARPAPRTGAPVEMADDWEEF
jgi:methyl-accepting chemotaxis protein